MKYVFLQKISNGGDILLLNEFVFFSNGGDLFKIYIRKAGKNGSTNFYLGRVKMAPIYYIPILFFKEYIYRHFFLLNIRELLKLF